MVPVGTCGGWGMDRQTVGLLFLNALARAKDIQLALQPIPEDISSDIRNTNSEGQAISRAKPVRTQALTC